jgi:hypothetical protein
VQLGEGGAEPLAVRRIAAGYQQAQPHQLAGEPRGDHRRPQVVAGLGTPAGKGFLLGDAMPLAGQQVPPHAGRVPGQRAAGLLELTEAVVEHLARGDLGQPLRGGGQPVQQAHPAPWVEAELAG